MTQIIDGVMLLLSSSLAASILGKATVIGSGAASFVNACLSNPGCTAIQTWGFTDKYSWIGWHSSHTQGAALPFDQNYQAKPAYQSLRKVLEHAAPR